MGKPLNSKLRWRRLPNEVRATCFAHECTTLTGAYCKRVDCLEPYCKAHKGQHILAAHTSAKLARKAGDIRVAGFEALPADRQIEILALLSKVRARRDVEQSDVAVLRCGTFVAWAVVNNTLVEKRAQRLEDALQQLYVDLRCAAV